MTQDPEAAWPLTTDVGYQPAPTYPAAVPQVPPTGVARVNNSYEYALAKAQLDAATPKPTNSAGILIAKLSIILGGAIPLSAIAASYGGLLGLIVSWIGIVLVAGIAMGQPITKKP
ncbi:MAG: hypothetical protein LBN10_01915 [Propionibacteriaceae bacterium]|jgi:hypothetical protein|nr:hypothetical protein [Propionibacteriaceae bacterium]